jgi:hypothetical protein
LPAGAPETTSNATAAVASEAEKARTSRSFTM